MMLIMSHWNRFKHGQLERQADEWDARRAIGLKAQKSRL